MRNELGDAWNTAYKAIRSLIVGRGSIQDRLYYGYTTLGRPDKYELTDSNIVSEWEAICVECTKGNPNSRYEDHVKATIYSMSDDEAAEMGSRIFSLFIEISKQFDKEIEKLDH